MKRSAWIILIVIILAGAVIAFNYASPKLSPRGAAEKAYGPDFTITYLDYKIRNDTNGTYKVLNNAILKNIGTATAPFISWEMQIWGPKSMGGGAAGPEPLEPGQSYNISFGFSNLPPGDYLVIAIADPFNEINELNENNNQKNITFKVP